MSAEVKTVLGVLVVLVVSLLPFVTFTWTSEAHRKQGDIIDLVKDIPNILRNK